MVRSSLQSCTSALDAKWPGREPRNPCRAVLAALLLCGGACNAFATPTIELRACRLESLSGPGAAAARCGHLSAPARREDPDSPTIRLHVAVIPALRLEPRPDPLFILSGGPGQAASDFYLSVAPAFARIRRDRDIVLIDQRGTGRSNRLDCVWPDEGEMLAIDAEALREAARNCLAALPGDPRDYTTSRAVRDLDEVRAALGYQRINLYGASYGTRVAMHYMRRHPTRVRTAILDGVAPPDIPLGPQTPLLAQAALEQIFGRCAAQPACAEQFPDLEQQFQALERELRARPRTLEIPHPRTAAPTQVTLGAEQLSAVVRMLSYTDETAALLPLLIQQAQAFDQMERLAAQYLMIRDVLDRQLAQGMHFAVVCSEDAPRWSGVQIEDQQIARSHMGAAFMQAMEAICADWPRGPVDKDFYEPLITSTPVLLLSGEADPATPAQFAAHVLPGFANARHIVLEGQGHGQIAAGCIPRLVAEFIDEGSLAELDDRCAAQVSSTPFLLSPSASAP